MSVHTPGHRDTDCLYIFLLQQVMTLPEPPARLLYTVAKLLEEPGLPVGFQGAPWASTSFSGIEPMAFWFSQLTGQHKIAQAIFEAVLPRQSGDAIPKTPAGILVSLADRLDSLVGLWAAGEAPRASADPFGLRRSAYGMLQVLCIMLSPPIAGSPDIIPFPAEAEGGCGALLCSEA